MIEDDVVQAAILAQMLKLVFPKAKIDVKHDFTELALEEYFEEHWHKLDYILTDNQIPSMNGERVVEITKEIKAEQGRGPIVAMVSGETGEAFKKRV